MPDSEPAQDHIIAGYFFQRYNLSAWSPTSSIGVHAGTYHADMLLADDNRLTSAPMQQPARILDVGTGTGIMAMELARRFPDAYVIGLDVLAPEQLPPGPENFKYDRGNAEMPWDYEEHYFDLIIIRNISGYIGNWKHIYAEANRCLKLGGYLEHMRAFIKDLQHETAVYERLRPLQGVSVPVFLGSIDLRPMNKIYYYDHRVYVVYMWFMSWGGYKLDHFDLAHHVGKKLAAKTLQSLHAIHQAGVVHKDVRRSNMLYNPETNRIMIIDFERSLLVQAPRRALGQIVPNKRKRSFDAIQGKLIGTSRRENRYAHDADEDIIMAKSVLFELNWYAAKQ
ncbi:hypothetical protein V2A60_002386 [Cordyceps javanica]